MWKKPHTETGVDPRPATHELDIIPLGHQLSNIITTIMMMMMIIIIIIIIITIIIKIIALKGIV